jgi:polysaccharide export outer membrane protein
MFQSGKRKLLAALIAVLGFGLGSAGCQGQRGSAFPYLCGQEGDSSTSCPEGSCPQDSSPKNGPPANKPGQGYLPGAVQQSAYAGDDTSGRPVYVQPGGPGCGPGGCGPNGASFAPGPIPTEINPSSHPPYTVAPPDILFIDTARLVPKPPYRIEPLEVLLIQVTDTLPNQPINGPFIVTPEGTINLGFGYGTLKVGGLTIDQIQTGIREHLSKILRNPQVSVALAAFRGLQQTRGEHLVRQDGTISLGIYGNVYVAGMTLGQIKCVIEKHLSDYVVNPQVAVDVYSYNSKYYYVIFDGGGYGQQIYKLPITGNETVLDAIANVQGMPPVSSQWRIWVARPAPCGHPCDQVLMVDWMALTRGGSTCTNYQLFPGDRVFVDADCLIKADNWLAKILAPVERVLGVTLLGSSTVNSIRNNNGISGNGAAFFVAPR